MSDNAAKQTDHSENGEARKAQKRRNVWLGLALLVFVVLVGVTTAIRVRSANLGPDGGFYWHNPADSGDSTAPELPEPAESPKGDAE